MSLRRSGKLAWEQAAYKTHQWWLGHQLAVPGSTEMLKAVYEKLDDVPEAFRSLYSERNGKFELTGVEGIKTSADVDRLQTALNHEKNDHKATKTKFAALGDRDITQVLSQLDRVAELEAAAGGKLDEVALEKIITARLTTKVAPLEREVAQLKTQNAELSTERDGLKGKITQGTIKDALTRAATAAKVVPQALDDMVLLGERVFEVSEDGGIRVKDGVGFIPGISPDQWLTDIKDKRPHWWPMSQGGGAQGGQGGSTGGNPWLKGSWSLSAQGAYVQQHGEAKAAEAAKAAGVSLGATKPAA